MADRTVTIRNPIEARVIEAGDLEFKVFVGREDTRSGEPRWDREEFPHSMLIRFETEEDLARAMKDGVIVFDPMSCSEPIGGPP